MALTTQTLSASLLPFLSANRWVVAYSGGVDSHVLLHLLCTLPEHPPILALHINHQLQADSPRWSEHCEQQAKKLSVLYQVVEVNIDRAGGESLEERARQERYRVFEKLIETGDVLMMGHHQDDQVETLLLRLLRGSGSRGLSAIPQQRAIGKGQLFRPLLNIPRSVIESYAEVHQLQWIEDPSNQQTTFDRNFLRQRLLPLLEERWPEYRQTLSRSAQLSQESSELNDELARLDFSRLCLSRQDLSPPDLSPLDLTQPDKGPASTICISLGKVKELSEARLKNLLRYWLQARQLPPPSAMQMQCILQELIPARADAEPLVEWAGVQARRFKSRLYLMPTPPNFDANACYPWSINEAISMAGVGRLWAEATTGKGLAAEKVQGQVLTVRFRAGGERSQPAGRNGSQTLKKLFQEYDVEPWLRDRVPLIYCADQLIAVADLWVCEGWQAAEQESGLLIRWLR